MKISIKDRIGTDVQRTIFMDGHAADVLGTLRCMGQLDDDQVKALEAKAAQTVETNRASVETHGRFTTVHVDSERARDDLIDAFLHFRAGKRIMAVSTPGSVPRAVQDQAIRGGFVDSARETPKATSVPNRHELTIVCGGTPVGRFTFNSMPEGEGLTFGTGKPVADGFQAWLDTVLAEIAGRMNYARGDLHTRMTPKRDTYTINESSPHPAMAHVDEQEDKTRDALRKFAERQPLFTTSPRAG